MFWATASIRSIFATNNMFCRRKILECRFAHIFSLIINKIFWKTKYFHLWKCSLYEIPHSKQFQFCSYLLWEAKKYVFKWNFHFVIIIISFHSILLSWEIKRNEKIYCYSFIALFCFVTGFLFSKFSNLWGKTAHEKKENKNYSFDE